MFTPFTIFGFTIDGWVLFGFFSQFIFFLRMLVQWISSERAKRSVIPIAYWYLSLFGNLLLFVYAFKRRDPVFTVGVFIGLFYYLRNIHLKLNEIKRDKIAAEQGPSVKQ